MQIRSELKKRVPSTLWPFLRAVDKYVIYATYVYLALRRSYQKKRLHLSSCRQSIPVFDSALPFSPAGGHELKLMLEKAGINCLSGRHSVYVGDKRHIDKINAAISGAYPEKIGLKIIKSRQLSPDGTPYYTSSELAQASTYWSMRAVGSMAEKVVVSNLLHSENSAPRVYDLIKLQSANGAFHYAFVVQHIDGEIIHGEQGSDFIARFKMILTRLGLETISISEHSDLRPPEFRNNIVGNSQGTWYVDIQNFVLANPSLIQQAKRSALQVLSLKNRAGLVGSRDTGAFLSDLYEAGGFDELLTKLLGAQGVALSETVFLTELRMGLMFAPLLLRQGVSWVYISGVDDDHCKKWFYLHGLSRISLSPGQARLLGQHRRKVSVSLATGEAVSAENEKKCLSDYIVVVDSSESTGISNSIPTVTGFRFLESDSCAVNAGLSLHCSLYKRISDC